MNARACYRMAVALGEIYIRGKERVPKRILLDFDSTDDPTHGEQEGSHYHGYYRQHMYHPLLVFDGEMGQLITLVLRPGNTHSSRGTVAILRRIVDRLRSQWPDVELEIRADAGFAIPSIYEYCEQERIAYTIGLITNSRLERLAEPLLGEAKHKCEAEQEKVRLLSECRYRAGSWYKERRVVYKAEVMKEGTNTRFVVTNRGDESLELYDFYVMRGSSENWIKDFKLSLKGDRLSCHSFWANQFRLLLHAAAYWLLDTLRRRLVAKGIARMMLDTLRLRLIKIGGRVKEFVTSIELHLASSHPGQQLWQFLDAALTSS